MRKICTLYYHKTITNVNLLKDALHAVENDFILHFFLLYLLDPLLSQMMYSLILSNARMCQKNTVK
jgi:hypothetical protein